MKILVACEESQRVTISFREKGHEAYSCDILPCSGGHPEWHIHHDVIPVLDTPCSFATMDGEIHVISQWDIIIAHPPCTYLTTTGNRWFDVERYGQKAITRAALREEAVEFFMAFTRSKAHAYCIENPVGIMSTRYRRPEQIIEPYWFGDPYEKRTCLWLKNLSPLTPTNRVEPEPRVYFSSGASLPGWYTFAARLSPEERAKERSKTFWGVARAMSEQWG